MNPANMAGLFSRLTQSNSPVRLRLWHRSTALDDVLLVKHVSGQAIWREAANRLCSSLVAGTKWCKLATSQSRYRHAAHGQGRQCGPSSGIHRRNWGECPNKTTRAHHGPTHQRANRNGMGCDGLHTTGSPAHPVDCPSLIVTCISNPEI